MGSWRRGLVAVALLLLLGAEARAEDALRLSVLVVVYPDTFSAKATPDEIENVFHEVAEAADYVQLSSGRRLELAVEPAIVDRFVPREDFQETSPGKYWLNDQVGDERMVEGDLLALGFQPDRYDVVAVFYAWQNGASGLSEFGAASFGVDRILGRATYLAVPMAWDPSKLNEYFEHELLHCMESIFDQVGHADFPHLHNGWAYEATFGATDHDWYGWVLDHFPYPDYVERPGPWGTIVRARPFAPSH